MTEQSTGMKIEPGSVRDNSGSVRVHVQPDIAKSANGDELITVGRVQMKLDTALEQGIVESDNEGNIVLAEREQPEPVQRASMPSEDALLRHRAVLGGKQFDAIVQHALAFGELDESTSAQLSRIEGANYGELKKDIEAYAQEIDASIQAYAQENGVADIGAFNDFMKDANQKDLVRAAKYELAFSGTGRTLDKLVSDYRFTKAHRETDLQTA